VPEGTEKVSVNQPIAVLLQDGESASTKPAAKAAAPAAAPTPAAPTPAAPAPAAAAPAPKAAAPVATPAAKPAVASSGNRIIASPLAKRVAANAGIDLAGIAGSGPQGRIVKADVDQAIAGGGARKAPAAKPGAAAAQDYSQPITSVPNSGMRKVIAKRLSESKQTIPHFYLAVDCDIDALLKLRKEINERAGDAYKLSVNDFVIKASALALRKMPQVNASWTEDAIQQYNRVDVSVAVATPEGLITPIVRDADIKSMGNISNEMKDLAARAKSKKLKLEEFQGGGFSISNLGMFGIKEFYAIVNPPQAAILAVGKGDQRAVVKNGQLAIANVMTLTLSCDHRVVDGAVGAEFMQTLQQLIEDPLRLLI
jgi:pyruvate dehydrogenase E2 component (dihydrolipoamide acetyltransferase)